MKNFLNESQVEKIAGTVNESTIASAEMKEDLIDHLCCIIEDEMSRGKEFETAYQAALQRFYPNGLNEIPNETLFLFTSKSRKRLDKTLYVSGFIALTGTLVTVVMKSLHLPFGQLVLSVTALIALFVFFPAVFVRLFRNTSGKKPIYYYFGFTGVLLGVISIVFIISHFPGGSLFLFLAAVCVYVAVFPLFFFKIFKKKRNHVR